MEKWQDPDTFLLWVIIIIAVMMLLIGTLISVFYLSYKKILQSKEDEHTIKIEHQRTLLKVSLDAQENERIRIAADLHDNIISKLTIIRLKTALAASPIELDQLLGNVIDESRRISHELSPPLYEEKSLENVLLTILKNWEVFYHISYYVDTRIEEQVSKNTKLQMVRILQELMHNIYKHAKASSAEMRLRITKKYITLLIIDNGVGFNVKKATAGIGLQNIELRTDNINAVYKFKSVEEKGTRFVMLLKNKRK